MATEIEHKYLVTSDQYKREAHTATLYRQGYLTTHKECVVRVRIAGDKAFITIKGQNRGATRPEYEFPIDVAMAQSMLDTLCQSPIIEKTRYLCPYQGHTWEIDAFHGINQGLVIAEIELRDEDEPYDLPPYIGKCVTGIERYYNSNLALHPYSQWSNDEKEL